MAFLGHTAGQRNVSPDSVILRTLPLVLLSSSLLNWDLVMLDLQLFFILLPTAVKLEI